MSCGCRYGSAGRQADLHRWQKSLPKTWRHFSGTPFARSTAALGVLALRSQEFARTGGIDLSTGQDNRMFRMRIADRAAQSWGEEESRVDRSPRRLSSASSRRIFPHLVPVVSGKSWYPVETMGRRWLESLHLRHSKVTLHFSMILPRCRKERVRKGIWG